MSRKYKADYYYIKNGSRGRTGISGYIGQHLGGAETESAVLNYLKKRHPGAEIELMKVEFYDQ